ncbi:TetR family transcriptional regulator [Sphingomonas sp. R1]|uniref:TetR family transcriptional regulator n=1 Tax=Sphingomonas sp. R1 TaxID=399176 RepID=UPI0022244866|nr:TetR family transcriptional regulator [Sphingomonas sp. R1]UYY77318.1 TetR family transcriptional regulator [Sphingomonas sp. R1]
MTNSPVRQLIDAARARIAAEGMRGLSLRVIAHDVGISLGSLSYRIGDKAALLKQLLEREHLEQQQSQASWVERVRGLDLTDPLVLSSVITTWIEDASQVTRVSSLVGCELFLEAAVSPDLYPGMAAILDAQDDFWRDLMVGLLPFEDAVLFGRAIASYIRDELPFSLAAGGNADYRLLRAATVECLASRLAGTHTGLRARFPQLVAACGNESAEAPLLIDLTPGTKRADIAGEIASLIAEQGVAAISHRAVAARAGVSNSSVAHYFRTRSDLLSAGFGALVLSMRNELQDLGAPARFQSWSALMRSTHAIALAAARDPQLMPFALDMRRRRAENGREAIRGALSRGVPIDEASIQSAALILVGNFLAMEARGACDGSGRITIEDLARLRQL